MTKDEARIILLEDALIDARNTINFLHNCLVNPSNGEMNGGYSYMYPDQTEHTVNRVNELLAPESNEWCIHSGFKQDCISCVNRVTWAKKVHEAKIALSNKPS